MIRQAYLNEAPTDKQRTVRSVSIAAPAYNEGEGIVAVVTQWLTYLRNLTALESFEIVICNDGSRDDTAQKLATIATWNPELVIVEHEKNQGAGVALAAAVSFTISDWVMIIDSDGQFPIENLGLLIGTIERTGALAAIGARATKKDSPFMRFGSWLSGAVSNFFHRTKYRDFNSACQLVQGDLLRSLRLECTGLNYSIEVMSSLIEQGVQVAEAEIAHRPRVAGSSSIRRFRSTRDRLLFVLYRGLRQVLLRFGIIRVSSYAVK